MHVAAAEGESDGEDEGEEEEEMSPEELSAHNDELQTELATLRAKHHSLVESHRMVLKYLEPAGWASTSRAVDTVPVAAMHTFPHAEFLK